MPLPGEINQTSVAPATGLQTAELAEAVLPVYIEEAVVSKKWKETGRVRVSTSTRQEEQIIDEMLAREDVSVERHPVGRTIDSMPAVREEGDTIIIPVVEEIAVVERRLVLTEEIHIKRVRGTTPFQERVVLRKQEAVVERIPAEVSD